MSHTVTAQHSSTRVEGLRAATPYIIQVRARTVAGYGHYSIPMDFSTSIHSTHFSLSLSLSSSSSCAPSLSHSFSLCSVNLFLPICLCASYFPSISAPFLPSPVHCLFLLLFLSLSPFTVYHCPPLLMPFIFFLHRWFKAFLCSL